MTNHYDYRKLSKCGCFICKKYRSKSVRKPQTEQEVILSKRYKFIRIMYCEMCYILRDNPQEIECIYNKIIKGLWKEDWLHMTLEEIYYDIKGSL